MNAPYLAQRAFCYGQTFFDPEVPYYNSGNKYHRKPAPRQFPDHRRFEDGSEYIEDTSGSESGEMIRFGGEIPTILNMESYIKKSIVLTFYGMKEEDDKTIELELDKRYAITYITEYGVKVADGYLRYISSSIPDDCVKYAGNYSSEAMAAFIGMDCSSKGVSDKRKIYLNTIRAVEALGDDEDYTPPAVAGTISDLLKMILDRVNYLDRCECKPVVDSIMSTVGEIKALQEYMHEHDEFSVDLDVNGDGVISLEELGIDENGNPIPDMGDDDPPITPPSGNTDPDEDPVIDIG